MRNDRRISSAARPICWASFPTLLCLIGCPTGRVDFETDTRVETDGSLTRGIFFAAANAGTTELERLYELPEGGTWSRSETRTWDAEDGTESREAVEMYSLSRRFGTGERIPPDHIRQGQAPGREVRNDIDVETRDYFFVRYFSYREVFRDEEGRRLLSEVVDKQYPRWVDELSNALAKGLPNVSSTDARAAVETVAGPWRRKLLDGLMEPDILERHDVLDFREPLADALFEKLPPPQQSEKDDWRERIRAAIDASDDFLDDDETVGRALFAVYDIQIFGTTTYRVKQRLSMPGKTFSTNATTRDGDLLVWEFEPNLLPFRDFVSEAQSRVLFPARIAGAALLLASILASAVMRRRRRPAEPIRR